MRKSLRYLRITWTVICGIACVLLIALWVRSLRQTELLYENHFNFGTTSITSNAGTIQFKSSKTTYRGGLHGGVVLNMSNWNVQYFVLLVIFVMLGVLPWTRHLKWHFSLRTLLIATTLIAVLLGLIVYLAHR